MNWEILIVPLIALGVWILSTIFRTAEERMEKNRPQDRPSADRPRPPMRAQSELDRFLEEARRRREQMQQRREESREGASETLIPVPAPPPPAPPSLPPPPPTFAPRPLVESPSPRREERPQRPAPVAPERQARLVADNTPPTPKEAATPGKPTFDLPASMIAPTAPGLPPPTLMTPATPTGGANRKEPPILTTLIGLLRDRQSLAAAFVLREILDRPLCMRGEDHSSRQGSGRQS